MIWDSLKDYLFSTESINMILLVIIQTILFSNCLSVPRFTEWQSGVTRMIDFQDALSFKFRPKIDI